MIRISTWKEETFEQRPKGKEQASPVEGWEEHSGRWEAVMPSGQYLGPDISKNSSVVVGAMSFLELFITYSGRVQKWLPQKTVISTLIYYANLSAFLELLISSSTTTSSQDLSEGWSGLQFRVPKALSEHKMHSICSWLYYMLSISSRQAPLRHLIPRRVFLDTNYFRLL